MPMLARRFTSAGMTKRLTYEESPRPAAAAEQRACCSKDHNTIEKLFEI